LRAVSADRRKNRPPSPLTDARALNATQFDHQSKRKAPPRAAGNGGGRRGACRRRGTQDRAPASKRLQELDQCELIRIAKRRFVRELVRAEIVTTVDDKITTFVQP
jgi:hypothetical protein